MLIYSFVTDYQAFKLRYKDNTTRNKNETKVGKQSANIGKNNEPIQNRLLFLIGCKSVTLHHFTILSFPMVRPAWDNWWLLVVTAFSPFYPLVTNSLSTTSDFCLSPLFIGRDKNGTKPENKISKNTFEPIKSLRHIVLSGAKFLQTSAMKTCFQIAECS